MAYRGVGQVTSVDAAISLNAFCGDEGDNDFLAKLCVPPRLGAFSYWLLNVAEQNREVRGRSERVGAQCGSWLWLSLTGATQLLGASGRGLTLP